MARPKKLTLDFFIHSASARHDRRIKSLRRREKNDGYATYYILLEMSCSEAEMKLHLDNEIIVEDIADECGLRDVPHLYKVIESCVSVGLFNPLLWKSERIVFSDDLYNSYLDRLEDRKATAERKQRFSEAKSLQEKIDKVTCDNSVVTQENQIVTQENSVVTQYNTPEDQNYRTTELPEIQTTEKEKNKETFFSDFQDQNQEAMQKSKSSVAIADQEDPTPLTPAPLSEAAIALKARFEAKFDRKANKYEPQGLTIAGFGEWHLGEDYNNWKPSLIAVAQKRKRDANQLDTPKAATDYIYNMARDCYREKHWGKFKNLISDAIDYEKALAANPTQSQEIEVTEPIVYDHDCRWEHYYPMKGRVNPEAEGATIIWGMINTRPPDPVDERCQKFLAKVKDNPDRLAKLLKASHFLEHDVAAYRIQAENFSNAKESLVAALNQEIEKLLQAA